MPAIKTRLRYVGRGKYLIGVPAVDHEVATRTEAKQLIETGLYELDERPVSADEPEAAPEPAPDPAPAAEAVQTPEGEAGEAEGDPA